MDAKIREIERTISASSDSTLSSSVSQQRFVRFAPTISVAVLPSLERVEARKARYGIWKQAPFSDELWDGERMEFREIELTQEEFAKQQSRKRGTVVSKFGKLLQFSSTEKGQIDEEEQQQLVGVDIVGARARVFAEDFDEEERDSDGKLVGEEEQLQQKEQTHIVVKLRPEIVDGQIVLTPYETYETKFVPSAPPIRGSLKKTKFIPSRPSDLSPTEKLLQVQNNNVEKKDYSKRMSIEKKPSMSSFVCGDEKRRILLLDSVPIQDEHENWDNKIPLEFRVRRKKSIVRRLVDVLLS